MGSKRSFLFILPNHFNLMKTRVCIQERQKLTPGGGVYNLVYSRQRIGVFWTCLVKVGVVDAHTQFASCLGDHHWIGEPHWVLDLADEASSQQLVNLSADEFLPLHGLTPHLLLHRSSIGADRQMVLNHLPRDPGHVGWLPCKNVDICPEESDELEFLFGVEAPTDASGLGL